MTETHLLALLKDTAVETIQRFISVYTIIQCYSNTFILINFNNGYSLVVVENLWEKSTHSNIFSFSESVHPQEPQKKSLNEMFLGKFF